MEFVCNNYLIYQIFLHCTFLAAQLVLQGWASCDSVVGAGSLCSVTRSAHSVLVTQAGGHRPHPKLGFYSLDLCAAREE